MQRSVLNTFLLLLLLVLATCDAFCPPSRATNTAVHSLKQQEASSLQNTSTSLSERRWNFNEGQSPWGLKKNAEIWNGRMAQASSHWGCRRISLANIGKSSSWLEARSTLAIIHLSTDISTRFGATFLFWWINIHAKTSQVVSNLFFFLLFFIPDVHSDINHVVLLTSQTHIIEPKNADGICCCFSSRIDSR